MLARGGARLVVGARRVERLEALVAEVRAAGCTADYQAVDVTQPGQVKALAELATRTYGCIDVMINNAGIMPLSRLEQLKLDEWNQMIDVNIKGVLYGIAAALPVMREQKSGHFVNVASTASYYVLPTGAVYSGTKYAVRAITDGLRQEVMPDLRVTLISPGLTQSELDLTISDAELKRSMEQWRSRAIPADAIARAILFAIEQPENVDVSEIIVRPTNEG